MTPHPSEAEMTRAAKPSKYRNIRTVVDGHSFASKAEARRYGELKLLLRAGEIRDLELQKRHPIAAGVTYVADFDYVDCRTGLPVTEDVKGAVTAVFRLKAKLFEATYHRPITLVRAA